MRAIARDTRYGARLAVHTSRNVGVAPLRELGTELAHALDAVPQPLDLLEQALRLRGRDQATLDALEEHQLAGLGGLRQHLADGRRRHVQQLRGAVDAAGLHDRAEDLHLTQVDRHAVPGKVLTAV
jgi:hypothetical protein